MKKNGIIYISTHGDVLANEFGDTRKGRNQMMDAVSAFASHERTDPSTPFASLLLSTPNGQICVVRDASGSKSEYNVECHIKDSDEGFTSDFSDPAFVQFFAYKTADLIYGGQGKYWRNVKANR